MGRFAIGREMESMKALRLAVLLGVSVIGCGGVDPLGGADGEDLLDAVDENAAGLDSKPWCVDHPCPDLVPVKFAECPKSDNRLVVRIKNQWTLAAGPSITRVFTSRTGSRGYQTPGLSPGQTYQFTAFLPEGCLIEPGCLWRVNADWFDDVDETSGNNNGIAGACIY